MNSNNADEQYRRTLSGKIQNTLLNARQHGGLERAEATLASHLEGELLHEATETAARVAEMAREGDWRGASALAHGAATGLADRARAPETEQLSRAEIAERVQTSRGTAAARRAMAEREAARTVYAHGQKPRPVRVRKQ